jgi:hypothetical protein
MNKQLIRFPTPYPLVTQGVWLAQTIRKPKLLLTQIQTVIDPSIPEFVKMVNVVLRSYHQTPTSEPELTNHNEVQEAIRSLKVG